MIETIDSERSANYVDKAWEKITRPDKSQLKVLMQVNTSSEEGNKIDVTNCYVVNVSICRNISHIS